MSHVRRLSSLIFALLAALALVQPARAEVARYPSGDETVAGHLALPKAAGKRPAVIVIHEWWGLNDFAKGKAQALAERGYVALAVDLYRGAAATDPDTAHQLMRGLPEDRALRDLQAAFSYLSTRKDVDPARIGVVGWCMGGGYSLALAMNQPKIRAAVLYYGRLATDPAHIARIKAPLLLHFGKDDKGIAAASVDGFVALAKKSGVRIDAKIYEGAGHGFASSKDPQVFCKEPAKDADARTERFFAAELK